MKKVKILQINAWTGRIKQGLTNFIVNGDFDVICMQEAIWDENHTEALEIFIDTVDKIKKSANFEYDYRSPIYGFKMLGGDVEFTQGNVILSKIPIVDTEEKTLCGEYKVAENAKDFDPIFWGHRCVVQKAKLKNGFTVFNYHGYWEQNPLGSATSTKYMRRVAEMIKKESGPVALCGDLNVVYEAPAMRELDFLQDLTAVKNIKNTLNGVKFKDDVACDHILINDDILADRFEVADEFLSDHKALTAELYPKTI